MQSKAKNCRQRKSSQIFFFVAFPSFCAKQKKKIDSGSMRHVGNLLVWRREKKMCNKQWKIGDNLENWVYINPQRCKSCRFKGDEWKKVCSSFVVKNWWSLSALLRCNIISYLGFWTEFFVNFNFSLTGI